MVGPSCAELLSTEYRASLGIMPRDAWSPEKPCYSPVTLSCLLPPAIFRAEGASSLPMCLGSQGASQGLSLSTTGSEGLILPPQPCVTHSGWDSAAQHPLSKPSSYLQCPAAPAAAAVPGAPRRSPPVPGQLSRSPGRPH